MLLFYTASVYKKIKKTFQKASSVYKFFNVPEIRGTKLRAQCKQCNASILKLKELLSIF